FTLLALLAFCAISVLGWWRAQELIFAGKVNSDDLGTFLSQNPMLTRICVTLLTVGLPVFAALAFEWGAGRLTAAWSWHRGRQRFLRCSQQQDKARTNLHALVEAADCQIARLEHERKEATQTYLQNYDLGRLVGAHRPHALPLVAKVVAVPL